MTGRPQRGELWAADLDSPDPAQARGRLRPVLIVQCNSLNNAAHPTTVVVPAAAPGHPVSAGDNFPLRLVIAKEGAMSHDAELLIDQVRAIDNLRLLHRLHIVPPMQVARVEQALQLVIGS